MKRTMAVLLAGMMAATVAIAQPAGRKDVSKTDRQARMAEKLGLTPEQQSAIDAIREREQPKFQALHDQIQAKAVRFTELRDANDPAADQVRDEVKALREEIHLRRTAMRAEIANVLTPAQRDQMKAMAKERGGRRGQGRRGGANGRGR